MKVTLYTQAGDENGTMELPEAIFDIPFNKDLVHQALMRQLANTRSPIAHVKNRSAVRGGGRKPFRQKGTGNARQGTIRAPHMRGGGVVFGPSSDRNFEKDMPKKQRRKALFCALSQKAREENIIVLESYDVKEPKTKDLAALITKLPVDRNVLIVTSGKHVGLKKSSSNLTNAKTIQAAYLNIHDLQKYRKILLMKDAVARIEETFLSKKA
ncbi:50S ribosomal protein L4 [Candidatus Gracilibacteria bacterium]|nr:50S ribosomal protein L4 [Candidatus Gracilibacteria bacterium]